jgi:hypothetical protein
MVNVTNHEPNHSITTSKTRRKRPLPSDNNIHSKQNGATDEDYIPQSCSLCQSHAVVLVESMGLTETKSSNHNNKRRKSPPPQLLCLLHFYTTDACRFVSDPERYNMVAKVVDPDELQIQLPAQQELFAEAYLQIQQGINDAMTEQQQQQQQQQTLNSDATTDLRQNTDDPLSILSDLNKHRNYNKSFLKFPKKKLKQREFPEGGFLRDIAIPERLVNVQEEQIRQQQELSARMNDTSKSLSKGTSTSDITQRRKSTRTNVWNIISQDERKLAVISSKEPSTTQMTNDDSVTIELTRTDHNVNCTCGSNKVEILSSNTNKSQDMAKAETWGNKDRHDEIITRCICNDCGKTWNDVE